MRWTELEHKVQQTEELWRQPLFGRAEWLHELDLRYGRGGFAKELRKGLDLVSGLDLFDVTDIGGAEELRSIDDKGQFRLRSDHGFDPMGHLGFPIWPGEQHGRTTVPRGPAADVSEVERVGIDELSRKIPFLLDSGKS